MLLLSNSIKVNRNPLFFSCFQFNLDRCHFLLDLDIGKETELEPNYSRLSDHFIIVKSSEFLDTSK